MADIRQTVLNVLSSPSARRIDFHLGTINVDAAGLAAIHNLVAVGTIQVRVVGMDAGVAAQYRYATDGLEFPSDTFGANADEKRSILHECIHALHDMYGGGTYYPQKGGSIYTTESENEAAAYVAGSLYQLYETGALPPTSSPIFTISDLIAKRIRNQRGAFVTTAEAKALRIAIVSNAAYNYGYADRTLADGP